MERATQSGVRQGLVGAVDLEAYSYEKGSAPLVRPSENTIVERIPPRLAVRRGAPLETPHIMMLLDDAACGVVEPFAKKKAALEKLYDTELMLGGVLPKKTFSMGHAEEKRYYLECRQIAPQTL